MINIYNDSYTIAFIVFNEKSSREYTFEMRQKRGVKTEIDC